MADEQTMNQKVVSWALHRVRHQVGRGQCWDLADQALRNAGARSSTTTGADDDYDWGDAVELSGVRPGDILQFRNFEIVTSTETKTTFLDGSWQGQTRKNVLTRPHHTAIIETVWGDGVFGILEQNAKPAGKKVQRQRIATKSAAPVTTTESRSVKKGGKPVPATIRTIVTVEVRGTIRAYHPQAKAK